MKPMISSFGALAAMVVLAAPQASALSCSQQAADLQTRQVKAQSLADSRLELVDEVEAAGDVWENAEALRHFSDEQAQEADAAKVEYEALKADLMDKEVALQALLISLNEDVAAFNAACVDS